VELGRRSREGGPAGVALAGNCELGAGTDCDPHCPTIRQASLKLARLQREQSANTPPFDLSTFANGSDTAKIASTCWRSHQTLL